MAVFDYSQYGIIPNFSGSVAMAFAFIKASIDRDSTKWEEIRLKRSEAGRAGGIATQQKQKGANQANASFDSKIKQKGANQAVNVNVPVNVNDSVNTGVQGADEPPRTSKKQFIPPTIDEVTAYCQQRGNSVDPQRWFDYYAANGWMVGRNHMKDWHAAVRTWERTNSTDKATVPEPKFGWGDN